MQITWHGNKAIKIQGKDATIVIDPHPKMSRQKADVVLASSDEIDGHALSGEAFVIETPGEFESKGAFVYGVPWRFEKKEGSGVLFRLQFEEISFAHLGAIDRTIPNEQLEILEGIDVLFLPVGDPQVLSVKDALDIIARIEPRIIIPININGAGLEGPEKFLKELGGKIETESKLKLTRKDLPEAERRVIVLEQS